MDKPEQYFFYAFFRTCAYDNAPLPRGVPNGALAQDVDAVKPPARACMMWHLRVGASVDENDVVHVDEPIFQGPI